MKVVIKSPETNADFKKYFTLRWEILRKPLGQPQGTEKDNFEEESFHIMLIIRIIYIYIFSHH